MGLSIQQGSFQLDTSTGGQFVGGVGFRPRAVMFWWGGHNADGSGSNERGSVGFAGDNLYRAYNEKWFPGGEDLARTVNQGAHAWMTRHNQNPTQAAAVYSANHAILALNSDSGTPSWRAKAYVAGYHDDGFDLVLDQRDGNGVQVYYLALGGSDIEQADVVTMQAPAATGNQSYDAVGQFDPETFAATTFQPTMLLGAGAQATSTSPGGSSDAGPHFGAARLTTERHNHAASNLDAAGTSNTRHVNRADALLAELGESRADLNAFLSTGFQLNWTAIGATRRYSSVLAIKGGRWKVGTHTAPTAVGDKATTGVGFSPTALISAGHGHATADTTAGNPYRFNLGARGPAAEAAMSGAVQHGVAAPNAGRAHHASRIISHYNNAVPPTVEQAANLGSFDADGFTLDYINVNATAGKFMYVAIAPNLQIGDGASVPGIASAEAFGVGEIKSGLAGEGIPSAEAFGVGSIVGPLTATSGGIASEEQFGVGTILGGLRPIPPTPEPLWRMIYTDMDGNVIGEIEDASDRRFTFMLNQPRVITFKLALQNRMFEEFASRKDGHILLYRDRELVMTTELLSAEVARGQDNAKALAVSALETMWVRLPKRLIGKSHTGWVMEEPRQRAALLVDMLATINAEDDTGIRTIATGGTTLKGGPWRYKPFMELVQELSARTTLNGFDFYQIPAHPLGTGITGYLDTEDVLGVVKPNAIFEFGTGKYNVKDYRWVIDRTEMINRGFVLPSEFPDNITLEVAEASDATQITAQGLREAVVNQDLKDYDLRLQLATEHVSVRKMPMERFFFTPDAGSDLKPFVDYDVGDVIVGRVKDQGVLALDAQVRVYGITVEPNDEGLENVNLTLVDEPA